MKILKKIGDFIENYGAQFFFIALFAMLLFSGFHIKHLEDKEREEAPKRALLHQKKEEKWLEDAIAKQNMEKAENLNRLKKELLDTSFINKMTDPKVIYSYFLASIEKDWGSPKQIHQRWEVSIKKKIAGLNDPDSLSDVFFDYESTENKIAKVAGEKSFRLFVKKIENSKNPSELKQLYEKFVCDWYYKGEKLSRLAHTKYRKLVE